MMIISEETKILVSQQKGVLKNQFKANLADIKDHLDTIAKLQAMNVNLRKQYDALDADIPEPTPVVEVK